jgi:type I restriction enzyme R subunit
VVDGSRIRREYPITLGRIEGHGKRGKALTEDYVLEYRNTKLAVVEAKAWDKPLTEGVGQAKDYLALRFTYASNGQGIYGIDMATGTEGGLVEFPSSDELWNRTFAVKNAWRDRFAAVPFEDRCGYFQGRYYQDIAVERVLHAIANGQDRILLTLATGTGKTFIAFQLAWKLFQSLWNLADWKVASKPSPEGEGWVTTAGMQGGNSTPLKGEPTRRPRILFLADRNILANQAFNAFSAFPEDALVRIEPADIRKKGKVPKNGSLFFTIFQTFMSGQATDTVRAESIEALRPAQGERNLITVRGELVEPRTEKFTTSKRQGSKPNCIIVYQLYN